MEALSTGSFTTPSFCGGRGAWLHDAAGVAYFDGTSGSGAVTLGHNHPRVLDAVRRQLDRLVHTGCKLGSDVRAELMERLAAIAPFSGARRALPAVIGAEAVEASLKIARAVTGRGPVVAFRHGYHGKSAGALAVTWRESFKRYSNLHPEDTIAAALPESDAEVDARLDELSALLDQAERAGRPPAAIILEPIQVTEGVHLAPPRFLRGLRDLARARGALLIFDEIYTGLGRAGALFHCQKVGVEPDLVVVGKTLGNGFPISAVLGPAEIVNALPAGVQTSTYSGHPVASAAALAVLSVIAEERVAEQAASRGEALLAALRDLAASSPMVARPRGAGMLLAFDCVDAAGQPSPAAAKRVLDAALARRLLLFGGGAQGATVKIVPPVLLDPGDLDHLVDALRGAVLEGAR